MILYQLVDQLEVGQFLFQCLFMLAYLECETLKVAMISKWATFLTESLSKAFLTDRISFKDWEILRCFTLYN